MSDSLRVLTFNIYIGHPYYFLEGKHSLAQSFRLESQVEEIRKLNPDIFCLQEMYSSDILEVYKEHFPDFNCFYIKDALAFNHICLYTFIFAFYIYIIQLPLSSEYILFLCILFSCCCYYFIFYTAAGNFINGNIRTANVIFYKKNKFKYKSGSAHYFHNQDGDILNMGRKRGFITLNLLHKNKEIQVINCHLSNKQDNLERYQPPISNINRYEQVLQLIKTNKLNKSKIPIIICGDFNSCNITLEVTKLKEYMQQTLENKYNHTWSKSNDLTSLFHICDDHQADYIFYKSLKCDDSNMVFNNIKPNLSDHYGVLSSLSFL